MSGFLGSGNLYYNRVVAGIDQGWLRMGNATKLEIKENTELKERISKGKEDYGQVLDSVSVKQPAELAITLDDLDKDVLAMAFLGDVTAINVTGASITDEGHPTADYGGYIRLTKGNVSNVVIKDSATGLITYVLDVDYKVISAKSGMIQLIEGDGTDDIAENEAYVDGVSGLKVSFDYASSTGNKVKGGTNSSIKVALMMDGENFADQSQVEVDIWEAVLAPQTGVDFLADDFATLELNGTLNTPVGYASAYEVNTDLAVV